METRSKRRQGQTTTHQQQQQQQPYPQIRLPSQTAPATPSSSLTSISSNNASQNSNMMLQTQQGLASAPLPSPSSNQPSNYFGSFGQQAPTSHPNQHQRIPQSQGIAGGNYVGQRGDGGGTPETAPFLKDFNLVAEAAKRAQMACLARDLGDVGL